MAQEAVFVKSTSPVEDQKSFLYNWDSSVRRYFSNFQATITLQQMGIQGLHTGALTGFKDQIQYGRQYNYLEELKLR